MTRLIDADELYDEIEYDALFGVQTAKDIVELIFSAPTIDAEPVKRGKWLSFTDAGKQYEACSECEYTKLIGGANSWCPACGARMEVEGE